MMIKFNYDAHIMDYTNSGRFFKLRVVISVDIKKADALLRCLEYVINV